MRNPIGRGPARVAGPRLGASTVGGGGRMGRAEDCEVLVVGGGLTGLSCAVFLAWHGVRCTLVERHPDLLSHPRQRSLGPRTLELYRQVGLEPRIQAARVDFAAPDEYVAVRAETLAAWAPAGGRAGRRRAGRGGQPLHGHGDRPGQRGGAAADPGGRAGRPDQVRHGAARPGRTRRRGARAAARPRRRRAPAAGPVRRRGGRRGQPGPAPAGRADGGARRLLPPAHADGRRGSAAKRWRAAPCTWPSWSVPGRRPS